MKIRPLTIIFPYYENPTQLVNQYARVASYPDELKAKLHLIVCDDGSPVAPASTPPPAVLSRGSTEKGTPLPWRGWDKDGQAITVDNGLGIASFQLFRVEVDIRWNWLTCRNIGAHHAKTDWLLLTDIDHEIPIATLRRIMEGKLKGEAIYRFSRRDAPNLTPYKPHPNSWLMTREMYDAVGGYDERFSGFYGTDAEFRKRCERFARKITMLDEYLIRVPREVVPDASTTTYERKAEQDKQNVPKIRSRIQAAGDRPHRLTFPYHQVV